MKKNYIIIAGLLILIILFFIVFRLRGEDSWIKDSRGVWIKHGSPSEISEQVKEQQKILECSSSLYKDKKEKGMEFSSQCLGTCGNYAIDVVHVPRNNEDNLVKNQCSDYGEGKVSHFIELDKDGEVVRIV